MTLPLEVDLHVAGIVHVHLAELASKVGRISDTL
jgi:hypothetical protein